MPEGGKNDFLEVWYVPNDVGYLVFRIWIIFSWKNMYILCWNVTESQEWITNSQMQCVLKKKNNNNKIREMSLTLRILASLDFAIVILKMILLPLVKETRPSNWDYLTPIETLFFFLHSFWEDGEPNNHINEDCGYMIKTNVLSRVAIKSWYDAPCFMSLPWICEKLVSTWSSLLPSSSSSPPSSTDIHWSLVIQAVV